MTSEDKASKPAKNRSIGTITSAEGQTCITHPSDLTLEEIRASARSLKDRDK